MDWLNTDLDELQDWLTDIAYQHKSEQNLWGEKKELKAINGFLDRLVVQMQMEQHAEMDRLKDPVHG